MSKGQNKHPKDNSIFMKKNEKNMDHFIYIAKKKSFIFIKSIDF